MKNLLVTGEDVDMYNSISNYWRIQSQRKYYNYTVLAILHFSIEEITNYV